MPADPPHLAPSFAAAWGGNAPGADDALERALADLHDRGRRAFPDVDLDARDLAAYAGERARVEVAAGEAVRELHAEDLFLACACARGDAAALRAFERTFAARIPAYIRRLRAPADVEQETRQTLLERIFVPIGEHRPRILQYSGRGSLEGWVRVAALRTALNLLDARRAEAPARDEGDAVAAALHPGGDPELLFLKAAYRGPFAAALREAFAAMPRRDRALLRFAVVDGLSPERIGTLYGVHRTTAMRWLDAARADVLARTRALLAERLHLSPSECDSVIDLVTSHLDVTLTSLLQTGT